MINRLENPERIAELAPAETLKNLGLKSNSTFCDIGAGTGLFTFSAARITEGTVYAVDISDDMLQVLNEKNTFSNVHITNNIKEVPTASCNMALLCTVLHEVENKTEAVLQLSRILKREGIFAVIEFHKRPTPLGPPESRRISEDEIKELMEQNNFVFKKCFWLGENFYCSIFSNAG